MSRTRAAPAWTGFIALVTLTVAGATVAYPLDDAERTGIRRLPWQQSVVRGETTGPYLPPGALWPAKRVRLRMRGLNDGLRLAADTPRDPALQAALQTAMSDLKLTGYGVAVLDLSDANAPRYAAVNERMRQTPGSIGKLVTAAAMLSEISKLRPSVDERERFLRETTVVADEWVLPNSHEVPIFDGEKVLERPIAAGDRFSDWEWLDHALSASSNAAGTITWREAALMRLLGDAYPPPSRDAKFFAGLGRKQLTSAAWQSIEEPLAQAGVALEDFRLRLFFTKGASRYVDRGESGVSPLGMLQLMLAIEQGRLVDPWTSREMKRLLYSTNARRRLTSAPELKRAAAFSKSGSLYSCVPERGYVCAKFLGNGVNLLNSVATIEAPRAGKRRPHIYVIAVVSNQLKRHAADDHARLAGRIHRVITGAPLEDPVPPEGAPDANPGHDGEGSPS